MQARLILLLGAAFAGLSAGHAAAQSTSGGASQASNDAGQVAEVVVTAQRRDERLQDVPVAVTAVQGSRLEAVGVQSAVDLRVAAPSLNSTAASGYVANSIRGVGALGFAPGIESPVGLYIDGVYLAAPQASELSLNNIDSVEVLKGPQGTLFGRNATGGLVQITTTTPTATPRGNFTASHGNLGSWAGAGYLSGGVIDDLAADISVSARKRDGFGANLFDGASVGAVRRDIAVRSKWVWTPGSDTVVTAIGSYWTGRDSNGWFVGFPGTRNGFVPGLINPDLGFNANTNVETEQRGWSALGALKIQQDFENVRLLSTTAYRSGVLDLVRDLDYSPVPAASLVLRQRDRQFSQEMQLSSLGASRLKWTAGLFYFYLDSQYTPLYIDLVKSFAGVAVTANERQTGKSYAGYGQATYEIAPGTNFTLGTRYTVERRAAIDATQNIAIPAAGLHIPQAFPDRDQTAQRLTYRISLDHRFNEQILGYVSYNTGFKSGGYNTGAPGEPGYAPEKLAAYEVGMKTDLFDRHLRVNAAAFYYKYRDMQVQRIALASLVVFNGARARIYGLDADINAVINEHFSLNGGFNWIDTKFEAFPECPNSTPGGGIPLTVGSCQGNQIPFAARFTGSLSGDYTTRIASGKLLVSTNVYYNSGYYFETDNVIRQTPYAKLGATVKWTSDRGVSIGAYGRNLTNRRTLLLAATQTSGNVSAAWADPREYGVMVGWKF